MNFTYIKDNIAKNSIIKCYNILTENNWNELKKYNIIDINYIEINQDDIKLNKIYKKLLNICEDREIFWCLGMMIRISKLGLDGFETWWNNRINFYNILDECN